MEIEVKKEADEIKTEIAENSELEHDKKLITCQMCNFITFDYNELNNHLNSSHYGLESTPPEDHSVPLKNFFCWSCEFETTNKFLLKCHVNNKHAEKMFQCPQCPCKKANKELLKQHINRKHLKDTVYKCELCSFETCYKNALKSHVNTIHTKQKWHNCQHCDYKSLTISTLKYHVNQVHTRQLLRCDKCAYKTFVPENLRRHEKSRHAEAKTFKCDKCKYRGATSYSLKVHIDGVHLKPKSFKCELCDYAAKHRSRLDQHVKLVHAKDDKYNCPYGNCGYTCSYSKDLKVHVKSHDLIKCERCFDVFVDRETLRRHEESQHSEDVKDSIKVEMDEIHIKDEVLNCDICDFICTDEGRLKDHIVNGH